MRRRVLASLLALAMLFGAGPALALEAWRSATTDPDYERVLRAKLAAEHLRVCHRALAIDTRLIWVARFRATDMVLNRFFAHQNPWTGRRVWTLLANAGLTFGGGGEVMVWNTWPDAVSPSEAFAALLRSLPHRAVIRTCDYRTLGVGAYKAGAKHMYVALYLRP